MKRELLYIELVFENVEVMRFSVRDIHHLSMNGITQSCLLLNRHNSCETGQLDFEYDCAQLQLILSKKANQMKNWVSDFGYDRKLPFGRIQQYPDITHVEMHYTNGSSTSYCVPWEPGKYEELNSLQETRIDDQGLLYVYIGKDK